MSDVRVPPGWYPDGATQGVLRWWDGAAWTDVTRSDAAAGASEAAAAVPIGDDRAVFAYLAACVWALPLILLLVVPFGSVIGAVFTSASARSASGMISAELALVTNPAYLTSALLSWVAPPLTIVFAALDHRSLRAAGLSRPFAWQWAFFALLYGLVGAGVYIIGRTVVLGRVRPRRWGPLVVFIVAVVVNLVVGLVLAVEILQAIQANVGQLSQLTQPT